MVSGNDGSTDGKASHSNTGSEGSPCMARVGSRSLPMYTPVIVCLGLLNTILLLTAVVIGIYCGNVSEGSSPYQLTPHTLIEEVKQLQLIQKDVMESQQEAQQLLEQEIQSHMQVKQQLKQSNALSDIVQMQVEALRVEKATLQSDSADILQSCGRCLPGWFLSNTSCYFHARSSSLRLKTWADSRADCISRGADLVVIDNFDEQMNLVDYLPKPVGSQPHGTGGIWIGLSHIQREGTWVWVNNVTQQGRGYWLQGQPSQDHLSSEDCAGFWNTVNLARNTWFDGSCQVTREWLCEKNPV